MKKLCILLVVILLLSPGAALAGEVPEETPSPSPTPTPSPSPSPTVEAAVIAETRFDIDNAHVYQGMDKAYKDGYTPSVHDGFTTIVMPLIATGDVKGNSVTVTPGLGSTTDSPFVYRNYQKTVKQKKNIVDGNKTKESYLIRLDLELSPDRINGIYPVTIDIEAVGSDNGAVRQSYTAYVTITDGKDPDEPTPTPAPPSSQPKVIVSGYTVESSPVTAGDSCTVRITLKNTSGTQSIQNLTVTAACDSPNFALQNDSDTIFISTLDKGQTTEIELSYKTDLQTPGARYQITLAMAYEDAQAQPISSSGAATVEVVQPLRLELQPPQIPAEVYTGDTLPLSLQVLNMGRGTIYNVRAELNAPGLIPTGVAFMGNMEAGTEMAGTMDVFIGTKNMSEGYDGNDKYGFSNGTITLIYEDADGREYTQLTDISTTIREPVIVQADASSEEEPVRAGQWWISVLTGVLVIAGLAAALIARKKRGADDESD